MTIALSRRAFIRASLSAAGGLAIAAFGPEFAGATTIVGEPWSDAKLIEIGYAYEQATKHRHPPSSVPPLPAKLARH